MLLFIVFKFVLLHVHTLTTVKTKHLRIRVTLYAFTPLKPSVP